MSSYAAGSCSASSISEDGEVAGGGALMVAVRLKDLVSSRNRSHASASRLSTKTRTPHSGGSIVLSADGAENYAVLIECRYPERRLLLGTDYPCTKM